MITILVSVQLWRWVISTGRDGRHRELGLWDLGYKMWNVKLCKRHQWTETHTEVMKCVGRGLERQPRFPHRQGNQKKHFHSISINERSFHNIFLDFFVLFCLSISIYAGTSFSKSEFCMRRCQQKTWRPHTRAFTVPPHLCESHLRIIVANDDLEGAKSRTDFRCRLYHCSHCGSHLWIWFRANLHATKRKWCHCTSWEDLNDPRSAAIRLIPTLLF